MSSVDIYSILSSKPHNPRYLNRYWKFIQYCKSVNKNISKDVYTEKHHICPKCKEMFPEYESFKENPWNKITLTARQHYISHKLLWKCYKNSSSANAFWMMTVCSDKNQIRHNGTSSDYEKLKTARAEFLSERWKQNNPSKKESIKELRRISALGNNWGSANKGIPKSKESIQKLSDIRKGHNWSNDRHKQSVAEANRKRKGTNPLAAAIESIKIKVMCEGVLYNSITEAQKNYPGIKISTRIKSSKYPEFYKLKDEIKNDKICD